MNYDARNAVSKHCASTAADHIKGILMNYTVKNFLLSERDIEDLKRIQDKCNRVP